MAHILHTNPDLYRGKQVVTGKWVVGYHIAVEATPYISICAETSWSEELITFENQRTVALWLGPFLEVKADTLCRSIGKVDKRGKEIYTQDIVKVSGATNYFAKVEYDSSTASYWLVNHDVQLPMQLGDVKTNFLEVVGNMIDNPELLTSKYSEEI